MHPSAQWDLDSYLKNNNKKSCLLPVQIKMVAANREQIKKKTWDNFIELIVKY